LQKTQPTFGVSVLTYQVRIDPPQFLGGWGINNHCSQGLDFANSRNEAADSDSDEGFEPVDLDLQAIGKGDIAPQVSIPTSFSSKPVFGPAWIQDWRLPTCRRAPPHKRACPVAALKAWRDAGGISEGAVFRPIRKGDKVQNERLTDRSVANIVKAYAARVGLDPTSFSGHSLRAGFLTSAAKRGANLFKMMQTSRHKSVDTLRGYVRDAELFRDTRGAGLL